ncbi:MAG: hypothetical protein KDI92_00460 [Xanthomonadales bacterium]|nr:hypothetical protein [Xanthomonadales bacterium]
MRKFKNLTKNKNKVLAEKFSFLLKYNDDCTKNDCSWAAITVFDHWLYESDSFHLIENATKSQKVSWDKAIKNFILELVKLETPYKYKFIGRNTKQKLQFSQFINKVEFGEYLTRKYDETYSPNIVFNNLGVVFFFEDYWTIHFKYKKQEDCLEMLKLINEIGLYVLPAYSAGHLNNYQELSTYMIQQGLK